MIVGTNKVGRVVQSIYTLPYLGTIYTYGTLPRAPRRVTVRRRHEGNLQARDSRACLWFRWHLVIDCSLSIEQRCLWDVFAVL